MNPKNSVEHHRAKYTKPELGLFTDEREWRLKELAEIIRKAPHISAKELRSVAGYGGAEDTSFNNDILTLRYIYPNLEYKRNGSTATYYFDPNKPDTYFVYDYPDRIDLQKLASFMENTDEGKQKFDEFIIELILKLHWPFPVQMTDPTPPEIVELFEMLKITYILEYLTRTKQLTKDKRVRYTRDSLLKPSSVDARYLLPKNQLTPKI